MTLEQVRARMEPIAARIARDYPESNKDWGITIAPLSDVTVGTSLRQSLRVLMAAVGMLLLVGCANLANLALARGTARETRSHRPRRARREPRPASSDSS